MDQKSQAEQADDSIETRILSELREARLLFETGNIEEAFSCFRYLLVECRQKCQDEMYEKISAELEELAYSLEG